MRPSFRAFSLLSTLVLVGCGGGREPASIVKPIEGELPEVVYKNPGPVAPAAPIVPAPEPHLPATTKYMPDKADDVSKPSEPKMDPPK